MRKQILAVALVFGGAMSVATPQAEAGGPIFRPGSPVRNIAQPFSTRRGRELQAERNQRLYGNSNLIQSSSRGYYVAPVNRSPYIWPGTIAGPSPRVFITRGIIGH